MFVHTIVYILCSLCLLYRVADTGILLVQSQVIPAHTTRGLRVLADWITKTWQVKLHVYVAVHGWLHMYMISDDANL